MYATAEKYIFGASIFITHTQKAVIRFVRSYIDLFN